MASNPDLVQYIVDQCAGAGTITARKMFGDYLSSLVKATYQVLPLPKPKKKNKQSQ